VFSIYASGPAYIAIADRYFCRHRPCRRRFFPSADDYYADAFAMSRRFFAIFAIAADFRRQRHCHSRRAMPVPPIADADYASATEGLYL